MERKRIVLKGLDHSSYEHPFDQKALAALEATPGLTLAGNFITKQVERVYMVQYTGSHLKVTGNNYPDIYKYLREACKILDAKKVPELYIEWGYNINACTIGSKSPIIVLNSGLIDLCDEDEIMFVIGHELGHVKSNHMLYHMMAQVINLVINSIPFGSVAAAPLQYALYYWDRMSEFTADRAGLLCCQNKAAAVRAFMKMSGMPMKQFKEINIKSKMILQVHDEIVIEVLKSELDKVKKIVKSAMELNQPLRVPLKIDINTGETWKES